MQRALPRLVAISFLVLAIVLVVQAWQQGRVARTDELFAAPRWVAAVSGTIAGLLYLGLGLAILRHPVRWQIAGTLRSFRFWRWLLAGWLCVFLLLGWWFPSQDVARFPCRSLCLFWLGLLLVPALLATSTSARTNYLSSAAWFRGLDLVIGNFVILFILLEVTLRGLSWWSGSDTLLLSRTTASRLRPGTYSHGLRANSLGFADEEFTLERTPGLARIAALGDSFSVGAWVSYEDNYLTRLEHELPGVEVLNFGVCGTGPREYRQMLAGTVWPYQPDLVLVPLFIGNDVTEWIAAPELRKLHPDALYARLFLQRSYRLARDTWRREPAQSDYRMTALPPFSAQTYLELTAGRLVVCRQPPSPSLEQRWAQLFAELDGLLSNARDRATPVALVLIPDAFQVDDALRTHALAQRGWSPNDLDLELPQRRLREYAAERGVPCLDLCDAISQLGGAAYFENDSHWNAAGHHLAARAVANWLPGCYPDLGSSPTAKAP